MKRILLAALTVIVLTAASCDYNRGIQPSEYTTNENLICSESFYVSSESTDLDTWTMGTIFLSGKDGVVKHAKIIAIVEIDSELGRSNSSCRMECFSISAATKVRQRP